MPGGLPELVLPEREFPEAGQCICFAGADACVAEQRQGAAEMGGGLLAAALAQVEDAETRTHAGFSGLVAGAPVEGQCLYVAFSGLLVVALAVAGEAEAG